MLELDDLDWQILKFLRADGRTPFREIARQVGVTEGTVRNRVNALTDSGSVRIIAVADPISLGVPILATTYARIRPADLEAFCRKMEAAPEVCYLGTGLGQKNVVVESMHPDLPGLFDFTQAHLHQPEVLEYDTVQVLHIRKTVWDWDTVNPAQQRERARRPFPATPLEEP
ncbi:Lrp/AsnC family transcriptional regulator [Deinococcus metallilatus]|uniref:Lrp/AsnC family transcriptional regulator for asnA, asnC and gidA n=1 Tax=Deinococcus metallilatus TaxID=1211322 RepID=A0ABR6MV64_9DEIO|nr:AsnC family transcriptional regulator [Deinococcus metallilatus]MBB5295829.1 Lrp/AsnC family transcriptional regulator for asnA, asnC and gidA [Deinococcus metallilatus]GMA14355.1 hypothetical protein GCM10025871_06860 [Deinococcus metallilatus]